MLSTITSEQQQQRDKKCFKIYILEVTAYVQVLFLHSILRDKNNSRVRGEYTLWTYLEEKLFGRHVGIENFGKWDKSFLDVLWRDPTVQILWSARLVVGARESGPAEWLLANYCAGAFVVNVEISSRIFQLIGGVLQETSALGKHIK